MKQLKYNTSSNVVRIDFPSEWDAAALTGLTLTIKNSDSTVLLAADSVTLYDGTTLDAAVSRYENEIVLAAGSDAPSVGDSLLVVGAGGREVLRVKGYDATTRTVTIDDNVDNDYDSGDSVYYMHGVITVDTTDTDAFQNGLQVQMIWTPTGTGTTTKELYEISKYQMDLVALRQRFQDLYPRAYQAYIQPVERFDRMVLEAEAAVRMQMQGDLMDYDRIVGQDEVVQVVMARLAYMWTFNGDVQIEDERVFLKDNYGEKYSQLAGMAIWQDTNEDDKKDDTEYSSHGHIFERAW